MKEVAGVVRTTKIKQMNVAVVWAQYVMENFGV